MAGITNLRILRTIPLLLAVYIVSLPAQAADVNDSEITAAVGVSTYVFVSDQSTVVQTGGIAGVHWTYVIEGQFQLSIDPIAPNAGVALFTHVDANATDDSQYKRTLDPNEVFNMTGLVGTAIGDTIIVFTGKAADNSDILIIAILNDDLVYLVGQTFPPAGSADFFIFSLDAVAQRKYGGGSGTADDPYQIATAEDLILLGETPEDYDKHFILTADIDLDPNLFGRKVFDKAVIAPDTDTVILGFQGTGFSGAFDGNGHIILHLTIKGKEYLGLFGQLELGNASVGEVRDLGVVDVNIAGSYSVGGLVGCNFGTVTRCYSRGAVGGNNEVGGLVGFNWRGNITNCYSNCVVTGSSCVGGLVGNIVGNMANCYSTGAVTGNEAVGGLVGRNGIQGAMPYPGYIDKSYSLATVRGETFVGGLVGDNRVGAVNYCYSTGTVIGHMYVGGLAGFIAYSRIYDCYSTGVVSGDDYVGGLVGSSGIDPWAPIPIPLVTNSFWDTQTSGQTESAAGTGKTTTEMQMASTFIDAGWDFVGETANGIEDIWWIDEGKDYPRLWWEAAEP